MTQRRHIRLPVPEQTSARGTAAFLPLRAEAPYNVVASAPFLKYPIVILYNRRHGFMHVGYALPQLLWLARSRPLF
jgi:hypothetical protein